MDMSLLRHGKRELFVKKGSFLISNLEFLTAFFHIGVLGIGV